MTILRSLKISFAGINTTELGVYIDEPHTREEEQGSLLFLLN